MLKSAMTAILLAAGLAPIAQADTVFSIGTGDMPDPFTINPATDADLNPASVLQGISSFSDAGAWASGTSYSRGDYVTVGGLRYVVLADMQGGSSFSADITAGRFVLYSTASNSSYEGTRFLAAGSYANKGNWSAGTSYNVGDKVTYNGVSYIAFTSHDAATASTNITSGNWVLASTAPDLSLYNTPSPVSNVCTDFDGVFYEGSRSYGIAIPFHEGDLHGTGTDLTGTLNMSVSFDWENEVISASGDVELTSYPAQTGSTASFNLASTTYSWLYHPFHTGNTCGRFKVFHSYTGYAVPNNTCFGSTMLSFYTIIQFFEKSGKYLPVAYTYPLGTTNRKNDIEFYNSIFNDAGCTVNTREHFATGASGYMKGQ